LVEQRTENPCVGGSIPSVTTPKPHNVRLFIFSLGMVSNFKVVLSLTAILASSSLFSQRTDSLRSKTTSPAKIVLAPTTLGLASALTWRDDGWLSRGSVREWRMSNFPDFKTKADTYLQYTPIAAVYVLDVFGVKGRHGVLEHTLLLGGSQLIMSAMVYPIKSVAGVRRPDGSGFKSFPSGHTAEAFVAATFLHREFGHRSKWYSIGAYTAATATGFLRILNDEHWLSDVIAGAGFGILSVNAMYLLNDLRKNGRFKKREVSVVPYYSAGPGVVLTAKF
jgi:membrane-associated phospholipid phosphatase